MPSLTVRLPAHAAAALHDLALVECRTPRDQAAFLILEGLRVAGPAARAPRSRRPQRPDPDRARHPVRAEKGEVR